MTELQVRTGQTLPTMERIITLPDMVAYAGATWDWHLAHYDYRYAGARGLPGPFVDGQMFGGILAKFVLDWIRESSQLITMRLRYKSLAFVDEVVRCSGEVAAVNRSNSGIYVEFSLGVTGSDGRDIVRPGGAGVRLDQFPKQ